MAHTTFTTFRIHYRTQFGDFISLRGSGQGSFKIKEKVNKLINI